MDHHQHIPAEHSLQWNIGILTAFGTMLLGMGQNDPTLPAISIFVAVTSILFTDRYRWFSLPRSLGNFAALVALAVCMVDFFQDRASQLLAIAHLLVYLQIILLYQQKSPRVYWQLIVLSLLQVVVAAALNEHINFGILLVGYLFTSLMAISRLFILRESLRAAQIGVTTVGQMHPALAGSSSLPPEASYIRPLQTHNRNEHAAASRTTRSMLSWPWATDLVVFCAGTLVAASLFFFMTPRIAGDPWEATGGSASVGFNAKDVSLNDLNQIQQSERVVMRVKLVEVDSQQPLQLAGELFLRGVVKTQYHSTRGGRWSNMKFRDLRNPTKLLAPPDERSGLVRQEFVMESTNHDYLFHAEPSYASGFGSQEIKAYPHTMELETDSRPRGEFRYHLLSDGFQGSEQREIVPQHGDFRREQADTHTFNMMLSQEMLEFDPAINPAVARIAQEQVSTLGAENVNRYAVAKQLEAYFTEPNRFQYTLDPQVSRVAGGRDTMEVFLTEVRAGHCEYFASALALMLRSRGIPSRLVVGYYGGDYNAVGNYYVVKEKYAHAWVEAYLAPEDIPPGVLPPGTDVSRGAWLRLNPTPEALGTAEIEQTLFTRISETFDYVEMLWREYVLNLDAQRQFDRIYQPLAIRAKALAATFTNLTDQQAWNMALENAAGAIGIDIRGQLRHIHWFYWPAGLVIISLGVVGILLLKVGRTVQQSISPVASGSKRDRPPAFYERFEKLAGRHAIQRKPGETPQELALRVRTQLATRETTLAEAAIPEQIVAALYQVRFNGRPLDKPEAEAIESALTRLAEALRQIRSQPS